MYARKDGDIFYTSDHFFAAFDRYPRTPGHSIIITNRHIVSIDDLTEVQWMMLRPVIEEVFHIIKLTDLKKFYAACINDPVSEKSIDFCTRSLYEIDGIPEGYSYGSNEGRAAGRRIDHFHLHLIPAYGRHKGGIRYHQEVLS